MTQWFLVYSQSCLTITIIWSQNIFITPSPGGSDGKESPCNEEDLSSIHGSGRSPGEGNGYPLQYSCLENSMARGAWAGGLPFMGLQRVGHDWATNTFIFWSPQRNSLPLADPPHTLHLSPGQPLIYLVSLWICLFFKCHINKAIVGESFVTGIFQLGSFQGSSISYISTSFLSIAK